MFIKHFNNVLLIILVMFSFLSFAQQKQKTEANADLIEYTNKEGLPTTNISAVVQTKDGYIWISGIERVLTDLMVMSLKKLEKILVCLKCRICITILQKI